MSSIHGMDAESLRALDSWLDRYLDAEVTDRQDVLATCAREAPTLRDALHRLVAGLTGDPEDAPHTPFAQLAPGTHLGSYELLQVAGQGGMGVVYKARRADGVFDREVAVKVLAHNRPYASRLLQRERELLARLDHVGIARILDGGETTDGTPYLVTEWVDGASLGDAVRDQNVRRRVGWIVDIADAVAYAHQRLVLHRDIKPGNVMVSRGGTIKLLDFGIAKPLEPHSDANTVAVMTPEYASPEQLEGRALTTQSDVYALGTLAFELLTGRHPFPTARRGLASAVRAICTEPVPTLAAAATSVPYAARVLDADLEAVIHKALSKTTAERYASAAEMAADLRRWLAGTPVHAVRPNAWRLLWALIAQHRLASAFAGIAALSLAAGLSTSVWQAERARRERDLAQIEANRQIMLREQLSYLLRESSANPNRQAPRALMQQLIDQVDIRYADDPEQGYTVLLMLGDLHTAMGDIDTSGKLANRVLQASDAGPLVRAAAHRMAAVAALRGNDRAMAIAHIDEAGKLLADVPGSRLVRAEWLQARAQAARLDGRMDDALLDYQAAEVEARASKDATPFDVGVAASNVGVGALTIGRYDDAAIAFERALKIWGDAGFAGNSNAATVRSNLAAMELIRGRYPSAKLQAEAALDLQLALTGDSAPTGATYLTLARALQGLGDAVAAVKPAEQGVALVAQFANPQGVDASLARLTLADIRYAAGEANAARALVTTASADLQQRLGAEHPLAQLGRLQSLSLAAPGALPADKLTLIEGLLVNQNQQLKMAAARTLLFELREAANRGWGIDVSATMANDALAAWNANHPSRLELQLRIQEQRGESTDATLAALKAALPDGHPVVAEFERDSIPTGSEGTL